MILISRPLYRVMRDAAETAYPEECCGLLAGTDHGPGTVVVSRVVPSENVAPGGRHDSFEVDPQVRFDLMRHLDETEGGERIVGHFHSHPDHPDRPSARDLAMAYEPDLVWVIISVEDGRATAASAHLPRPDASAFREIPLRITGS